MVLFSRKVLAASFVVVFLASAGAIALGGTAPDPAGPAPPSSTGFDAPVTPVVGVRPLLTVLMEFTDERANVSADAIHEQIFGARPSVNDYFLETTYGQFSFSDVGHFEWVTAYDNPATSGDESTRAFWDTVGLPTYGDGYFQGWGLLSLDQAGYDFAPLDLNGDGAIAFGTEVSYLVIDAKAAGNRGGASRCMPNIPLDGKASAPGGTLGCSFGTSAGVSEDSPWITLYAHELGHEALDLADYYAITPQNIGYFTLMGYSGTGGWAGPVGPHHLDPFSKLKRGWYSPTVVASDGFVDLPDAETNPAAFILHDPARGTEEYFMVENRWRGASYDHAGDLIGPMADPLPPADAATDIPDEGLLVWHVDETRGWDGASSGGFPKVALERRDATDEGAAFNSDDPSYYDFYDGSSVQSAKWNDGTESGTGVWCASAAGATMRAWLDVPGPGVLICSDPLTASAAPGSAATYTVPLRNTGDAEDTFAVSVSGLGAEFAVTVPAPVTLGPKAAADATVLVEPVRACTTAPGARAFTIEAQSVSDPSVASTLAATLEVPEFGAPQVSLDPASSGADPGGSATYAVALVNGGNAEDTMALEFAATDFGTAYRALPTAIPSGWVALAPDVATAPACESVSATLTIAVPADWAGIEDAAYGFTVAATSSVSPAHGSAAGELVVRATALSAMRFVRAELEALVAAVSALPSSEAQGGLLSKAQAALAKFDQAFDRYLAGEDPPAANLLGAAQNVLRALGHELDAQRGKALTEGEWADLAGRAAAIDADLETVLALL